MKKKEKRRRRRLRSSKKKPDQPSLEQNVRNDAIDWNEAVRDVSAEGLLEEHGPDPQAGAIITDFVYLLESGDYHVWEAIIRREQGLALDDAQLARLSSLISFSDEPDERIQYYNGLPRPARPWYETFRAIVQLLWDQPSEQFVDDDDRWLSLVSAIREHVDGLSLPDDVDDPLDVIEPDQRHRLFVRGCTNWLAIASRWGNPPLEDDESSWLVDRAVDTLRDSEESLRYLGVTPRDFADLVDFENEADRAFLVRDLVRRLSMPGPDVPIAGYLAR